MATFYIDGQSIGNERREMPRRARIAIVYQPSAAKPSDQAKSRVISEEVGDRTNNEAEYLALLRLLSILSTRWTGPDGKILPRVGTVRILSDSNLLVNQVKGDYRVKEERLRKLREDARKLIDRAGSIVLQWVPRDENYAGLWLEGKWRGKLVQPGEFLVHSESQNL